MMQNRANFSSVKAIYFDTANTLYTNEEMEEAYPRQLAELMAVTKNVTPEEGRELLEETTKKLKDKVKHVTKVRAMAELGFSRAQVHEAFCKVNPGKFLSKDKELDAVMARLAKRYQLGIISNFKRSHILEILKALGLSPDWFPLLVTEDIVTEIKPDPEPFLKAVELAGCSAGECLYVADSPTKDMEPAKGVGMMTVLAAENPSAEDLAHADGAITDVKKIVELLGA